ncbi:B3 domain-containing transcription repressor VAL2 isoform X1 [Sesamum indicum]|uniref:B3 domain-containing transcription repressor VAL2 isoform X1 n=2 Tax=Sesamum indicum TaxID=4182 RepID=A0A6I9U747_SESIN|nr:B3 domain-containing transcription repressor VAL2 isoform X1 [Sesamum indicum]XP_020553390.1 B3 domain-containing transcription repressor VAL2 isoform X1 [Sesamum indicum]XP_020553391.1 B3 domain-containing transcription repressor VAL2 isoform X1 [Sesamum indicum]
MEGGVCMNGMCASSNSLEWRKGWPLRSGGFATLCDNCGTAYKQLVFCEMFHSDETGWRECASCGKRLHCGCIASSSLLELLDTGGVSCKGCSKSSKLPSTPLEEKHKACDLSTENGGDLNFCRMAPAQSGDDAENDRQEHLPPPQTVDTIPRKQEDDFAGSGEIGYKLLPSFNQSSIGPSKSCDALQETRSAKSVHESLVQTNLSISLSASSNSNSLTGVIAEERQLSTAICSFQQGCRPRHLLPRLPNSILAAGLETNSGTISQLRVARPPVEGRVKNQLLPRYWPRITDQELQQISGDSNSTIVPLFEKVLSASDAGRIGRLVLPKACAEAYFPPISQPEGLPLRIQDVKGKEWVFQFRFWPNNNSRMYVLEGVTPCIQSMQLQAGDTVTFSRMDPEGKLLMGFRKASNSISVQKESHYSMNSGALQGETLLGSAENLPLMSGYSGLLQSLKGSRNSSMNVYSGNINPKIIEKNVTGDNLLAQPLLLPERKRRNIGPKSKRLLIDGHDSLELRLSWEEVQEMLRPPPSTKPSTISVEDHEFEEFEEPPVFGKRSIFIVRLSGEHEQWTQCDSCFKWRKMPIDVLLPPKWTCRDNITDQARSSCSAPDELSPRELENLLRMNKDFTKRRVPTSLKPVHENESQDLETLTNAAAVGGGMNEPGASSVATTTKHPRHRPGCSCIVCIQPPSGKGKHKPTCLCNVCMTVKRRFKTLMMRKKKRQSEREAEIAQRNQFASAAEEAEVDSVSHQVSPQLVGSDNAKKSESEMLFRCQSDGQSQENAEILKGGLDLNCCPGREHTAPSHVSMMSLLQEASLPLETYLRQNGLTSLVSEQQASAPLVVPQAPGANMAQPQEDQGFSAFTPEHEEASHELSEKDQKENDTS